MVFGQIADLRECRIVADRLSKHLASSGGRPDHRHHDLHQGALAGSIGSEETEDFTGMNLQGDTSQGEHTATIGLRDVFQID